MTREWHGATENPSKEQRGLYGEMVRLYAEPLYRFALSSCQDLHLAEDLVQETFGDAWKSLASLRDTTRARAWLFAILRNRIARSCRTVRQQTTQSLHEEVASADSQSSQQRVEDQQWVQSALSTLPGELREPLLLVMMEGFSAGEAAEVLKIPRGTVLSRLHRARRQLRDVFLRMEASCSENS